MIGAVTADRSHRGWDWLVLDHRDRDRGMLHRPVLSGAVCTHASRDRFVACVSDEPESCGWSKYRAPHDCLFPSTTTMVVHVCSTVSKFLFTAVLVCPHLGMLLMAVARSTAGRPVSDDDGRGPRSRRGGDDDGRGPEDPRTTDEVLLWTRGRVAAQSDIHRTLVESGGRSEWWIGLLF